MFKNLRITAGEPTTTGSSSERWGEMFRVMGKLDTHPTTSGDLLIKTTPPPSGTESHNPSL